MSERSIIFERREDSKGSLGNFPGIFKKKIESLPLRQMSKFEP
jgi:hypothetical protein